MSLINSFRNALFRFQSKMIIGRGGHSRYIGDTRNGQALIEKYQRTTSVADADALRQNRRTLKLAKSLNQYDRQVREYHLDNPVEGDLFYTAEEDEHIGRLEILSDLEELEKVRGDIEPTFYHEEKGRLIALLGGEDALAQYAEEHATAEAYYQRSQHQGVDNQTGTLSGILRLFGR